MRIEVRQDTCVAAGQCVLVADEIFDQDDDGIVMLLDADPSPELQPAARRAEALCPARAIHVHD